jgi:hypothetical protein
VGDWRISTGFLTEEGKGGRRQVGMGNEVAVDKISACELGSVAGLANPDQMWRELRGGAGTAHQRGRNLHTTSTPGLGTTTTVQFPEK